MARILRFRGISTPAKVCSREMCSAGSHGVSPQHQVCPIRPPKSDVAFYRARAPHASTFSRSRVLSSSDVSLPRRHLRCQKRLDREPMLFHLISATVMKILPFVQVQTHHGLVRLTAE